MNSDAPFVAIVPVQGEGNANLTPGSVLTFDFTVPAGAMWRLSSACAYMSSVAAEAETGAIRSSLRVLDPLLAVVGCVSSNASDVVVGPIHRVAQWSTAARIVLTAGYTLRFQYFRFIAGGGNLNYRYFFGAYVEELAAVSPTGGPTVIDPTRNI